MRIEEALAGVGCRGSVQKRRRVLGLELVTCVGGEEIAEAAHTTRCARSGARTTRRQDKIDSDRRTSRDIFTGIAKISTFFTEK